jgi:hypothetical protein
LNIDLTTIATGQTFNATACETISQRVAETFRPEGEATKAGHVSVFALGPMALLAFLGSQLTSKVPVDLFQRHRDTESWTWKRDGPPVSYKIDKVHEGDVKKVAVVFSLSGKIDLSRLPDDTGRNCSIYEVTLDGVVPTTTFLRTRQDLEVFRLVYQELLATIAANHGYLEEVDVFPAVPAPIAVLIGRERLQRVHPRMRVFDQEHATGWTYQLTV